MAMGMQANSIPAVDEVLRTDVGVVASARFGHEATVAAIRAVLGDYRGGLRENFGIAAISRSDVANAIIMKAVEALEAANAPRLRRVFNLTGTVLHTNLGRAVLADQAIAAASSAMRAPATLEFDLETGGRGERDDIVRGLVCELTGAEDAIVVNNNAAAVLLVLNTLALGKETVVSRGELIEIGGAFRMPDIMARAGTKLHEVGTTNRTHMKDYEGAINSNTGLILKVHTSNYMVQGFTKEVHTKALAKLGRAKAVAIVDDLGSGTLVDLARYGLPRERTVQDAIKDGADLVTFSGDKLLGGPQAGFIIGRKALVEACAKNPIKRAVRLDKVRLAALEATLKLYRDPDSLRESLPTLRHLSRLAADIHATAERVAPLLGEALGEQWSVSPSVCASQIGSGALPLDRIASAGVAIAPRDKKQSGRRLDTLSSAMRRLPVPVIGRIEKGALILDLRCLDEEAEFIAQLDTLTLTLRSAPLGAQT
jgi:L-seryl-tRNA(Ser) seleniumtransferase